MSEHKEPHSEAYQRARSDFDALRIEDKAVFLVEATVSTLARGIEAVGRAVSDELDRAFRKADEAAAEAAAEAEAAAAEAADAVMAEQAEADEAGASNVNTGNEAKKKGKKGPDEDDVPAI